MLTKTPCKYGSGHSAKMSSRQQETPRCGLSGTQSLTDVEGPPGTKRGGPVYTVRT